MRDIGAIIATIAENDINMFMFWIEFKRAYDEIRCKF